MDASQVKEVRDNVLKPNEHIRLYLDSTVFYDNKFYPFIWDDAHEIVYIIQSTAGQEQADYPVCIQALQYSAIDYMLTMHDKEGFTDRMEDFVSAGLVTEDRKEKIIEFMSDMFKTKGGLHIQYGDHSYDNMR